MAKCVILADNPSQPLGTYPWNAFTCGHNSLGWVWLVSIARLSDTQYAVEGRYLPTFEAVGYMTIADTHKAKFFGPDGQSVTVTIAKHEGNAKDWKALKVWAEVVGYYTE
jgi:hypothetical protein